MEGLNSPKPREKSMVSSNSERCKSMPRVSAAPLHFRHAVDGEIGQRFRLDDLFDVGASQATDGAKRRVPKELGPLDLLNVVAELTRDFRRR